MKVAEAAKKQNLAVQDFCDKVSAQFKTAWENLDINYSHFIRTTDSAHEKIVVDILNKLKDKGVLYEADYQGLYCTGCEKFILESELIDGLCVDHKIAPQTLTEKNWFFKLSDFLPQIKKAIETEELEIYPKIRKNEVLGLIDKQHLPDFSISRSAKSVSWGIDLPWDKNQKVYVWIDALSNYITALDYPKGADFKKFWPADIQVLGLDILKFHALYWPAILLALDLPLPKRLAIHGYFTINGQKMSKTIGNVIDPNELVTKFGAEATKYLLVSPFSFGFESDVKQSDFVTKYNADLVNGLGNLVNRVTNMIEQYLDGIIDKPSASDLPDQVGKSLEQLKLREALLSIWSVVQTSNEIIDKQQPWVLYKAGKTEEVKNILQNLANDLYSIAIALEAFLPQTATKMKQIILAPKVVKPVEPLFKRLNI
jgi:methionyl-tRNA synthetase